MARNAKPGQLGFGLPARGDQLVDAFREIRDIKSDLSDMWSALNAAAPVFTTVYQDTDNLTFPNDNTYHNYGLTGPFIVPPNCTRLTYFLWCAAGVTWSGGVSGNLSVQCGSSSITGGTAQLRAGPAIGITGVAGGGTSVETVISGTISNLTVGTSYYFSVFASANGASPANSANTHINGVLMWTKN